MTKCALLWGYGLLERERYGSRELRVALQRAMIALADELVAGAVAAADVLAPPRSVVGSVFAEGDEEFREFLNAVFTAKDAFSRPPYFREIIATRNQPN
jgi:hypothetical protein